MLNGLQSCQVLHMRETLVKGTYIGWCTAAIIDVLMDDQVLRDQMLRLLLLVEQFFLGFDSCKRVQVYWLSCWCFLTLNSF